MTAQNMRRSLDGEAGGPPWHLWLGRLRQGLRLIWLVSDRYTKVRLVLVLALVSGAALFAALTPVALKLAVDGFSGGSTIEGNLGPIGLIVLYVLGQYVTRGLSELRLLAHDQAQGRAYRNIGLRMFEHLLRLPMRFHLERRTGAMGQIAEQGVSGCEQLLHNLIFTVVPVGLEFIAVAVVLVNLGYPVYLAILVMSAVGYVIVFSHGTLGVQEYARSMASARVDAHAAMTDSLLNTEAVKYYDAENVVCEHYSSRLKKVESAWLQLARQRMGNGLLLATVFALSLGSALVYAAYDVTRGAMTIGDFVLVNSYIMRFVGPLELLGLALREVIRALANLQGLFEIFGQKVEQDLPGLVDFIDGRGQLSFDRVTFSYREGTAVLRDISFDVPAGRTLAVVGMSGSGKSSLIRLMFRLYDPDSGQVLLDGVPISQLPLSLLRQAIAVVPQDTVLFHDSIANNIAFGRNGASFTDIKEAARIANLHEFIDRQPDGYETIVGERGLKLSGGERQRVAIARAALKRPRIFVFDEATSSLDSRTEREILHNLREVSRTSTTLVIAHRLSTVIHADEIVVLNHGVVVERGTHNMLRERGGHYSALWLAQHSGGASENMPQPEVMGEWRG